MANFAQKKIALAVASTLVVSGVAQAAVPAYNATGKSVLVKNGTWGTAASADELYTTAGIAKSVDITLRFAANVAALTNASTTTPVAPIFNTGSGDNITVKYGTTLVPSLKFNTLTALSNAQTYTLSLDPAAAGADNNARLRIDPATGMLQYSPSGKVADFANLNFDVIGNAATAGITTLFDSTTVGTTAGTGNLVTSLTQQQAYSTLVPSVEVRTHGPATATGLVDGLTIDFKTAVTTPTSGVVTFQTAGRALSNSLGTTVQKDLSTVTGAFTYPTAAVASKYNTTTSAFDFVFDGTKVDWNNDGTVDSKDAAAYNGNYVDFGTGVTGATKLVAGTQPVTYTNVFDATSGLANTTITAAILAGYAIKDGVAPYLVGAESDGTNLVLKFSEGLKGISTGNASPDAGDLKEIAENINVGGVSLAALNLNLGGNALTATLENTGSSYPAQNQLKLANGGKLVTAGTTQINVVKGIGFKEPNDTNYDSSVDAWDIAGLQPTAALATLPSLNTISATGKAVTAPVVDIKFDDGKGSAITGSDPAKISKIKLNYAGKAIAFTTGNDATKLNNQIVVKVDGTNVGGSPLVWEFFPTFAATDLNTAGDTLMISLPTDLLYTKFGNIISINVKYLNSAGSQAVGASAPNYLINKTLSTDIVDASTGGITVSVAKGAGTDLLTQSIIGTLEGASDQSTVKAYLAKWNDKATSNIGSVTVSRGLVTNTRDKDGVVTDLALQFGSGSTTVTGGGAAKGNLEDAIKTQLNAVAAAVPLNPGVSNAVDAVKAKDINAFIQVTRSNDAVTSGGGNTQLASASKQQNIQARAVISNLYNDADFNAYDPIYAVTLNAPAAGATSVNITGRLTGKLDFSTTANTTKALGVETLNSGNPVAEGLVDSTGKFNLLLNIKPDTSDLVKKTSNAFVILVHDDQSNARRYTQLTSADPAAPHFVPFEPNLLSGKGVQTVLGANGVAAAFTATTAVSTAPKIKLSNYVPFSSNYAGWKLQPLAAGNPNVSFNKVDIGRSFVGIDTTAGIGTIKSAWTNDTNSTDMAFALANGQVGVATETGTGKATLSTLADTKFVTGASALAWSNDTAVVGDVTFVKAPALTGAVKIGTGWSLVTVPAAGLNAGTATTNTIKAVIRVGGQTPVGYSWFEADGGTPTVTAGEAVFVYAKTAGNL